METAVLSNRLWVPRSEIRPRHFEDFTYQVFDTYTKEVFQVETFDEDLYQYGFARGDLRKINEVFGRDFNIDDQRAASPIQFKLRFTGELTPEQQRSLSQWIGKGYGILEAPPRWGKTVWMTALMCKLRQRTLMLAHLEDLCHQLEETIRRFTNINELEQEHGKKLCGVLQEWNDFFPIITLSTYQCFAVSPRGRNVIQEKKDHFGLVLVDEAHRCKTQLYTEVVGELNSAYRCGVTATPKRKDRLHVVVNDVIGPVTARGEGEQLDVEWTWEYTDFLVKNFRNWSYLWNRLIKQAKRNNKIVSKIVEDVEAGHFVLVTTERLAHIDTLRDKIKKLNPDITIGELSGRIPPGRQRETFREKAKRGEYQVVIAMNKIVELGYNIPRWSCFHNTLPMTNRPNWYQRISRIRTPMEPAFEGDDWVKPHPVARIWVDYGHKAVWAYQSVVRAENKARGFRCLNPEKPRPKGKRKGLSGMFS